jgi:ATP-dependent Clp protease, protease subunit
LVALSSAATANCEKGTDVANPAYVTFNADIQPPMVQPFLNLTNELIQQGHDELHVLMSSSGGRVMVGFSLYHTLRALPLSIVTYNIGNIDSIANVLFLAGDTRYGARHATFMFHGVNWGVGSPITGPAAREVVANIQADEDRIAGCIADRTKLAPDDVRGFFNEAATKDAEYALRVGIVQEIRDPDIPSGGVVRHFFYSAE